MLLLHFGLCQSWRSLGAKWDQSGGSGSVHCVMTTYRADHCAGAGTKRKALRDEFSSEMVKTRIMAVITSARQPTTVLRDHS